MKDLLNQAMAREGLLQKDLAQRCGVSRGLISMIISGKVSLSVSVAKLIEQNMRTITARELLDAQTKEQLERAA
ncbi:helix-turn-helix transcriptional regulator [Burkholderia cenocepacia]|uniref:helix-turn-helix domain-containing protein n=1 Tax=Burkholderia cenocepacia TaxID=95486 RepID=UPI001CF52714|nr:helix-turn-helix transcriptional regulator [Burkholderia cenocepacia]MCA7922127.1 helix-turn-helix transcriptional regulator [Burkholderia cenocepacia]